MNRYSIETTKTGFKVVASWTEIGQRCSNGKFREVRQTRRATFSYHKTRAEAEAAVAAAKARAL